MTLLPVANGVLQTPVPRHWTGETVGYGWQLFLCLVEKFRGSARTGRISESECQKADGEVSSADDVRCRYRASEEELTRPGRRTTTRTVVRVVGEWWPQQAAERGAVGEDTR